MQRAFCSFLFLFLLMERLVE
uniref:Uncharacterized protein n=1 Tax=Rhizophora mucronata TaxID=61149 RepID=A0A2P2QJD2_RHIMU